MSLKYGLTRSDYSQADMLGVRYTSVDFGAGKSPGSPHWSAQKNIDRRPVPHETGGGLPADSRDIGQFCPTLLNMSRRCEFSSDSSPIFDTPTILTRLAEPGGAEELSHQGLPSALSLAAPQILPSPPRPLSAASNCRVLRRAPPKSAERGRRGPARPSQADTTTSPILAKRSQKKH